MKRLFGLLPLLFLTAPPPPPEHLPAGMTARQAEAVASDWWSRKYRRCGDWGAAWTWEREGARGTHVVGISDGKAEEPGRGGEVTGGEGAFFNTTWDAKYRAWDGLWYKNAEWFGQGDSWEDALYDAAARRGYPALTPGGRCDRGKTDEFVRRLGRPPVRWHADD